MKLIFEILAKESKIPIDDVVILASEITTSLIREGFDKDDPKLLQYLVRRLRKRLNIKESITYQSFKEFFNR